MLLQGTFESMNVLILLKQISSLLEGETDQTANLANASAFIMDNFQNLNWAGFYLLKNQELVLGPFQGKPACNRIQIGAGVCGTAFLRKQTINVPDVHQFEGHIACDNASNSELVIPLYNKNNHLIGVLDLDSPLLNRFSAEDKQVLEEIAKIIADNIL